MQPPARTSGLDHASASVERGWSKGANNMRGVLHRGHAAWLLCVIGCTAGSAPRDPSGTAGEPEPSPLLVEVFASTHVGIAPLDVSFASLASGGTAPHTFSWAFGDGSPEETLATTSHTFAAAGMYVVRLTVSDAE